MDTVTIPLNNFDYVFKKLTFEEEFALTAAPGIAGARVILTAALVTAGDLAIPKEDAPKIVAALSNPVINRVWLMYKVGLPEDRFFTTRGLYRAPQPNVVARHHQDEEDSQEAPTDRALAAMEQRFGIQQTNAVREQERMLLEDAKRRGVLVPASEKEPTHG
jgi:hypothetical protein